MTNQLTPIYMASTPEQAHLMKNTLAERGIAAHVTYESYGVRELYGWVGPAQVLVAEEDAEQARRVVVEFEPELRASALSGDDTEDDIDEAWPCCPHCKRPRHTSCPHCETAGTRFPRAYQGPDGDTADDSPDDDPRVIATAEMSRRLLVVCTICDEPFAPEFPARCEWCGHRFADGRELPVPKPPIDSDWNARVWFVVALLAGVVLSTLALFMHIARSG